MYVLASDETCSLLLYKIILYCAVRAGVPHASIFHTPCSILHSFTCPCSNYMHNSGQQGTPSFPCLLSRCLLVCWAILHFFHRGMIKCSGSYVFTPDGAMRAWVSANCRLIRSAWGQPTCESAVYAGSGSVLTFAFEGRGIGSANTYVL
ncbi:hypothetical protein V8C42DRAFT_333786 [Trichoderma barbatum]